MISLTQMVSGRTTVSEEVLGSIDRKAWEWPRPPTIAVWNVTNACNLRCRHCYASSGQPIDGELTTEEALRVVDELRELGVKILIFSGGEPLLRKDIYELCGCATQKGMRALISTNGVMIDDAVASELKSSGVRYVGVSLDGLGEIHDNFRGARGSFDRAVRALKTLKEAGLKVGIRFTAVKYNLPDLPGLVKLIEDLGIPRLCVYHLVYSGRGAGLIKDDLPPSERRSMLDFLLSIAAKWREMDAEIETVASPADGVYAYLWIKRRIPEVAEEAARYLEIRGGDPSATRLISIDPLGNVHPNQFWWDYTIGNVREESLIEIWYGDGDPLLRGLREKHRRVKGKCGICPFKRVCGGFRLRALRVYGDPWEEDPACFLSDREILDEDYGRQSDFRG